jgi:hypothetical protein
MAITVPIGFLAIMKIENAISRFNRPKAACFCAVRWVTLRRARFFQNNEENAATRGIKGNRWAEHAEITEAAEKGSGL